MINQLFKKVYIILAILTIISLFFLFYYNKIINGIFYLNYEFTNKTLVNHNLLDFQLNHKNIIEGKSQLKLVFNGFTPGGYCNKLYSVISSLLIAILTKSALIIRWHHIDKYIQEPLFLSFKVFSDSNEFNAEFERDKIYYPHAYYGYLKNKNMDKLINSTILLDKKRTLYNSIDPFFFEICCNPSHFKAFLDYKLVKPNTIERAYELLKNLSSYSNSEKMRVFLHIGFEVGGNLLNYFWKPKQDIQNLINDFIETKFIGYYVIGLQIRIEFLYNNLKNHACLSEDEKHKLIINQFSACALNIELNITKSLDFARKYKGVKWFVISDAVKVLDKISDLYPDKVIRTNGTPIHVLNDNKAYFKAILDNELLSKSDELVLSSGSSFGFVAALRKKVLPLYIDLINYKCARTDFGDLPMVGSASLI